MKLSEKQEQALVVALKHPDHLMEERGPTRSSLMRRGLVFDYSSEDVGQLTALGCSIALDLRDGAATITSGQRVTPDMMQTLNTPEAPRMPLPIEHQSEGQLIETMLACLRAMPDDGARHAALRYLGDRAEIIRSMY